jgi:hypothetical protein
MNLATPSTGYGRVAPDQSNRPKPYEEVFQRHLDGHGWDYLVEPDKLLHQPFAAGRPLRGMTPDIRLTLPVDGLVVYLELTEADRFASARQLPARVRRHNRRQARSRRPYISPAEYLALKRQKIATTMALHPGVVVVLIDFACQQAIYDRPDLLDEMIAEAVAQRLTVQAA